MDFLSDKDEAAACDILTFTREAVQRYPTLQPLVVARLLEVFGQIKVGLMDWGGRLFCVFCCVIGVEWNVKARLFCHLSKLPVFNCVIYSIRITSHVFEDTSYVKNIHISMLCFPNGQCWHSPILR